MPVQPRKAPWFDSTRRDTTVTWPQRSAASGVFVQSGCSRAHSPLINREAHVVRNGKHGCSLALCKTCKLDTKYKNDTTLCLLQVNLACAFSGAPRASMNPSFYHTALFPQLLPFAYRVFCHTASSPQESDAQSPSLEKIKCNEF